MSDMNRNEIVISRSERVRDRRSTRTERRVERAASHARVATAAPLITTRGGMGQPVFNRTAFRPRRKFFIALDGTGAEIAMPAIPFVRPGWRLVSGLICIAMLVALVLFNVSDLFVVTEPQILGNARLSQADIAAALGLKNSSVFSLDITSMRLKLEKSFPELAAVAIRVTLPGSVNIEVLERQPVIAWKAKDKTTWIDQEGVIFPVRGEAGVLLTIESSDAIPLQPLPANEKKVDEAETPATASQPAAVAKVEDEKPRRMDGRVLLAALTLSTQMPQNSRLVYSTRDGLGWSDPRGWKVFFGANLENMEMKLSLYQSIVDQLTQKKIKATLISVENVHAPFYRLER